MNSLYLDHFGLVTPPFSITPDPGFFFEGKDRGLFMSGLLHATLNAEGIVIVIGEVGSGKTLMSRILLSRLPDYVDTVYLPNPAFSRDEIIDVIARDLGLAEPATHQGARLEVLQQELIRRHTQGRRIVVLIDEAHTMPPESLEEVRRLSNLETDNHKLVQIILFGQPELSALLDAPQLRQVNDRVVYRLTLRNLSKDDTRAYLDHRLRVAGWRGGRMFTWFAERRLLADATGRARRINLIADKSLLAAYADQSSVVRSRHVQLAIRDVGKNFAAGNRVTETKGGVFALWLTSVAATAVFSIWITSHLLAPDTGGATPSLGSALAAPEQRPDNTKLILNPDIDNTQFLAPATGSAVVEVQPNHTVAPIPPDSPPMTPPAAIMTEQSAAKDDAPAATKTEPISAPANLAEHIKHDRLYAEQQGATNGHAIQLATIQSVEDAAVFISVAERALAPDRIFVRRSSYGKESGYPQSRYVIYLGNYATFAAANRAIAQLPDKYRQAKPIIRSWKGIIDAPWTYE